MFLLWQWRVPTCCSGYTLSLAQFWSANRSRRICILVQLQLKKVTWSCRHQRIKLVSYRPIGWAQMEQLWHLGLMVNGSWVWILWGSLVVSGKAYDHNCSCAPKTNQSQDTLRKKPNSGFLTWYGDFNWTMMNIDKDRSANYKVFRWLRYFHWHMYNACDLLAVNLTQCIACLPLIQPFVDPQPGVSDHVVLSHQSCRLQWSSVCTEPSGLNLYMRML